MSALYIHIPFCASKCGYCGLESSDKNIDLKEKYIDSLLIDLSNELDCIKNLDSVFIGGGTPNMLLARDLERIFNLFMPKIKKNCEITIELNPHLKTDLVALQNMGINRASIGIQSFNESKLRLLNRAGNPKTAIKFIQTALDLGLKTNIDLIYGVRNDSLDFMQSELETALNLGVNHISAYELSLDLKSSFYSNNIDLRSSSNALYRGIKQYLEENNFSQYEISNFAKNASMSCGVAKSSDKNKCAHNLNYWAWGEYIGAGLGAVGRVGKKRLYKHSNINEYLSAPTQVRIELLSDLDIAMEKIFLGARSEIGIDETLCNASNAALLIEHKKCVLKNGKIYNLDYAISDEIALWLMK